MHIPLHTHIQTRPLYTAHWHTTGAVSARSFQYGLGDEIRLDLCSLGDNNDLCTVGVGDNNERWLLGFGDKSAFRACILGDRRDRRRLDAVGDISVLFLLR